MLKALMICLSFACLLSASCARRAPQQKGIPEAWEMTANDPPFTYLDGFFGEEGTPGGPTWRWMEPYGFVALKNPRPPVASRLVLRGSCPVGSLQGAPTIKITFNQQVLEEFIGTESFEKTYAITPTLIGPWPYSELRISSTKSFVPRQVNPQFQDDRQLALQITQLIWEPVAPPPSPTR